MQGGGFYKSGGGNRRGPGERWRERGRDTGEGSRGPLLYRRGRRETCQAVNGETGEPIREGAKGSREGPGIASLYRGSRGAGKGREPIRWRGRGPGMFPLCSMPCLSPSPLFLSYRGASRPYSGNVYVSGGPQISGEAWQDQHTAQARGRIRARARYAAFMCKCSKMGF